MNKQFEWVCACVCLRMNINTEFFGCSPIFFLSRSVSFIRIILHVHTFTHVCVYTAWIWFLLLYSRIYIQISVFVCFSHHSSSSAASRCVHSESCPMSLYASSFCLYLWRSLIITILLIIIISVMNKKNSWPNWGSVCVCVRVRNSLEFLKPSVLLLLYMCWCVHFLFHLAIAFFTSHFICITKSGILCVYIYWTYVYDVYQLAGSATFKNAQHFFVRNVCSCRSDQRGILLFHFQFRSFFLILVSIACILCVLVHAHNWIERVSHLIESHPTDIYVYIGELFECCDRYYWHRHDEIYSLIQYTPHNTKHTTHNTLLWIKMCDMHTEWNVLFLSRTRHTNTQHKETEIAKERAVEWIQRTCKGKCVHYRWIYIRFFFFFVWQLNGEM